MPIDRITSDPVLDIRGALARLDGDDELLVDLIGFFLEDSGRLVEELKAAATAGDAQQVKMASHALKGLVASCGGMRAADAAQRIEHASTANDLTHVDCLIQALEVELGAVRNEARGYIS
jgi:HPt (histidine-containing phosphotransfer) domain-containing protein